MFDTLRVFLKEFFNRVDFEKISRRQKRNFPGGKDLICLLTAYVECSGSIGRALDWGSKGC